MYVAEQQLAHTLTLKGNVSMNIYSLKNPPAGYYVYAYLRKKNDTPYYIGKGKNKRAWNKEHKVVVPKDNHRIVIIESNLTELGAIALERRLIKWYGRKDNNTGILRNLTDGGEGMSGAILSDEHKEKIRSSLVGKEYSKERRRAMSESKKGKTSPRKGVILSDEIKLKMSLSKKGKKRKPLSEEHKEKLSEIRRKYYENLSSC